MYSTSQLFLAMIFGAIGLGFLAYGKKQRAVVPLLVGIVLLIFPYFVANVYILAAIGTALVVLPYFVRI